MRTFSKHTGHWRRSSSDEDGTPSFCDPLCLDRLKEMVAWWSRRELIHGKNKKIGGKQTGKKDNELLPLKSVSVLIHTRRYQLDIRNNPTNQPERP